jgi:hypothetical protein
MFLSAAAHKKMFVRQFDVKSAFLNGRLHEEIYMRQPPGYNQEENKVCKLIKSLYGLKQAAKVWNDTVSAILLKIGFRKSEHDKCLYVLESDNVQMYLIIHVDDMLIACTDLASIRTVERLINGSFEVKDLGNVKTFLSIEVERDMDGNFSVHQSSYIEKIISAAGQEDSKISKIPMDEGYYKLKSEDYLPDNIKYRQLIGMLLYVCTNTRPDVSASVCILSQKVEKPTTLDMNEVVRIIRYLKGTRDYRLKLSGSRFEEMVMYSDANWAEDRTERKSNNGHVCFFNGGTISWSSRKQECVALSSCEAEYIALSEAVKEVIWLRRMLMEFGYSMDSPTVVKADNQSAIKLVDRERFSNTTKHIDTRYHFIKEFKRLGEISLEYVCTEENVADMLTKPLGRVKLTKLRQLSRIVEEKEMN